jgi:nucleoside phosphorylase/predicted nucleotidyltransferase
MTPLRAGFVPTRQVDLTDVVLELMDVVEDRDLDVWIFGSRRYGSHSPRSDIDLVIRTDGPITQGMAGQIWDFEPYLDIFRSTQGVATSLVNGTEIIASDLAELLERLSAVQLVGRGTWLPSADTYRHQTVLAKRSPAATLAPFYDLEDAVPAERADILVLTALPKEHAAVSQAICGFPQGGASFAAELADREGSPWRIRAVTVNAMGSVTMALETARAIRRTKATHVVLVGICAGIKNNSELLDVIVPGTITYYEPGKVMPGGIENDYKFLQCDRDVEAYAATLPPSELGGVNVKATHQVMACGEKVVSSKKERARLVSTIGRKLSAIDMESYGMVRAALDCRKRPTVIKSVCDLANRAKNDDFQDQAASNAAQVLRIMIETGAFGAAI